MIEEARLFILLDCGYNMFYMIKKALKHDEEFGYEDGLFFLRRFAPQRTLDEVIEDE